MKKFFLILRKFEDGLSAILLSGVVILTLVDVVYRYILKSSLGWSQEITGFMWTWTVMIGTSLGYRRNLHYGVDFLVQKLPIKSAIILKRAVYFLMLLTCIFLLALSITITKAGFVKVSAWFGIPYFYKYISAVICFALMLIHTIQFLVLSFTKPNEFFQRITQGGLPGLDDDESDENEGGRE